MLQYAMAKDLKLKLSNYSKLADKRRALRRSLSTAVSSKKQFNRSKTAEERALEAPEDSNVETVDMEGVPLDHEGTDNLLD